MPSFRHPSFAGGEISPELHPNIELPKRQVGVELCRNFTIDRFGTVSNRAGLAHCDSSKNAADKSRLIKFQLNKSLAYVIELGDNYMRIYQDCALVTNPNIAAYSAIIVYVAGNVVSFSGINYSCKTDTVLGKQPDISFAQWHVMTNDIVEAYAPWELVDLFELNYAQSGNFIRLANNNYPVFEIERLSDVEWAVKILEIVPSVIIPDFGAAAGAGGAINFAYKVTGVDVNGEESLPGHSSSGGGAIHGVSGTNEAIVMFFGAHVYVADDEIIFKNVRAMPQVNGRLFQVGTVIDAQRLTLKNVDATDWVPAGTSVTMSIATATNPVRITTEENHGFLTNDDVYIHSSAMTQINDLTFVVTKISDTEFDLQGINGLAYTPATDGVVALTEFDAVFGTGALVGAARKTAQEFTGATPTALNPNVITVSSSSDHAEHNIYKAINGVFGFIGVTTNFVFNDDDIIPDQSINPPKSLNIFNTGDDYPAAISHFQQRLCLGNVIADPELFRTSRTADVTDFTRRTPLQADDPVTFSMRGRDVSEIRHIIDLDNLVILTEGGEWVVRGDQNGSLVATSPNPKQAAFRGADTVRPVTIGNNCVYVQNRTGGVRDLGFEIDKNTYVGTDLTEYASHLFFNRSIVDWAYQQTPNSIIWAVMDDGDLIALTYIPEIDVWGWHRHDSNGGFFESIVSIPEDNDDYIYVSVRRVINGSTVRRVERINNRRITSLKIDAIFLDSYITVDGRNTTAITMTLTTITTFLALEDITCTASAAHFVAGDVDKFIILRSSSTVFVQDLGQDVTTVVDVKAKIIAFTSTTIVTIQPEVDVPTALQGTPTADWGRMINVISGLGHLESEVVSALGDGNHVSGFDEDDVAIAAMTVTAGIITLTSNKFYEVIHIGTRYYSDLKTLEIDSTQGETLQDKVKRVSEVTITVSKSKNFLVGIDDEDLVKTEDNESGLIDGKIETRIPTNWNESGSIFIRQAEPLPLTVVSVIAAGEAEGLE